MSFINFKKEQLINLEYSLKRELLRSNRAGSYANSTIINCNTRKYHGLLIVPQPAVDNGNHVLLSSLDETIIQRDAEFHLGIHKYKGGVYQPKGHKYVRDFTTKPIPKLTYRVGGVVLTKEMIFSTNADRMLIKYTLEDAHSPTKLRFKPFLAFRNVHNLSKANNFVEKKYEEIPNGIKLRMYTGYSHLHLQFSKHIEYTHIPDWYYNIEYDKERERGYDYLEDLYVPGFFEVSIKKGESIYFSAGIKEINPASCKRLYNNELKRRVPRNSFENCLINSAQQFIVKKGKKTKIIAGFPWFGSWGRDTFISLPGLTIGTGDPKTCKAVIDTMISELKGPMFANISDGENSVYNSVDASLWFFWTLQKYAEYTDNKHHIWKEYGEKMKMILNTYRKGTIFNIKMLDNGLLFAGETGKAITWMDAIVEGKPVTPRIGLPVEINALWYNAIMFSLELAKLNNDNKFVKEWEDVAKNIPDSFKKTFWDKKKRYLADYVNGEYKNWDVRPNQVIATSLPYTPIDESIRASVLEIVKKELLTPRGLRSLSPKNPNYKGLCFGNQALRDLAYHQGTVWPWLLGHFVEGYLKIYKKKALPFINKIYFDFEEVMDNHGIGTVSEIYDGDPPYTPRGCISQAWSVAELLRIGYLIKKYEDK